MERVVDIAGSINGQFALLAYHVVGEAAELIRRRACVTGFAGQVQTKSTATDLVTEVDRASESLIRARLHHFRPRDTVLGEEGADSMGDPKQGQRPPACSVETDETVACRWIVDPLDGTANFVHGIPAYAVSLACERDGRIVASAVADVVQHRTYVAARGIGAFLADVEGRTVRLEVSRPAELGQSIVATGFSCIQQRRAAQSRVAAELLPQVADLRRFGAAALDGCLVAAGVFDAYFEHGISGWDFAGASLIAEEAGAVVRVPSPDASSVEGELAFMSAPSIADDLTALLASCGAAGCLPLTQ